MRKNDQGLHAARAPTHKQELAEIRKFRSCAGMVDLDRLFSKEGAVSNFAVMKNLQVYLIVLAKMVGTGIR